MNSVSILSWWWLCRVFGRALWPLLLPWPIDFPNKAEGARTRAPIVHFNPCNFFPSRRRNNWSRPKSGGGESHKGLNHFQVGRGGEGGGGPTSYKRLNDYAGMNGEDFINQEGINLFQVGPHFWRGVQASIRKESRTYTPSRAKRGHVK